MKKLLNFRPVLFITLSLCCGIATAYFSMRKIAVWGAVFSITFLLCLLVFVLFFNDKRKKRRNFLFLIILILSFCVGGLGGYSNLSTYENANLNGHYYKINGKIKECNVVDSGLKLVLDNVSITGNRTGKIKYCVSVLVYGSADLDIGDLVAFSSTLIDKSFVFEGSFNASNVERGIKYSAKVDAVNIEKTGQNLTLFERVNLWIRDTLKIGLGENEFAVGYAMLTGNSDLIDYDLVSAYRTAGVAHIFAVSGLHIGFLAVALTFIFDKLKIKGFKKALCITVTLLFYSGVCGFSASSIRATVMTAVLLFSSIKGERYDGLSATALAAFIILIISPMQLLSVGFQLSFSVVIGINLLSKPVDLIFKFLPKKISDSIGTVIAAQIFSIPISLYAFGKFSWIAILANLIFIPIVSVIFTFTLVMTLIGGLFNIAPITLFLPNYVLKFVNTCIRAFDQNFFMISGVGLGGVAIAYYAVSVVCSGLVNLKRRLKMVISLVLVVLCITSTTITNVNYYNSVKLYVSGSDSVCSTMIVEKDKSILIISDTDYIYSASRLKRLSEMSRISTVNTLIFMGGYKVDMQVFLSKLHTVFSVESVFYYGERDHQMEDVIKKSFLGIQTYNFTDGMRLPIDIFECAFNLNGNVLIGNIAGKRTAIFSAFKVGVVNLTESLGEFDLMICDDRAEELFNKYTPDTAISYRHSYSYINAETNGNLFLKLT